MSTTETRNGWLAPDGSFFIPAEPTPPCRIRGESLSGHEQAALNHIEAYGNGELYDELDAFASAEANRLNTEFMDWSDTDGRDIIKRFFESKGFKRDVML